MRTVDDFIDGAMRKEINFLLATFPVTQNDLFNRAWPNGVDRMCTPDLRAALALCFRTEASNDAKRAASLVTSDHHS